ncbi:MAG TPA: methylenetetrahydrofolate reductase, partial [Fimbriimonadaceae bacterium]|nr:methylenetetrahydrofolate reductase [Fimbriimonadaceae bacterium]
LKKCKNFQGVVDAVNVTDNQSAIVRMSSLMVSAILVQEGLEPIMQLTCRDRNRLALQSELLSAGAAGIRNILCLTGDHQSIGNQPDAKGVFDLDSTQFVAMADEMSRGFFMNGEAVKPPPALFVGATTNPFAEPLPMRVWNLAKKIKAGARFIQTQPVFDIPRFETWMEAVRDEGLDEQSYILAGAMPVRSAKALYHMRDNVPGMRIADEYVKRMESASEPQEEGVAICVEVLKRLRETPGVKGVHIMPVMWESITPRLVEEAGLLPAKSGAP